MKGFNYRQNKFKNNQKIIKKNKINNKKNKKF